MEGTVPTSESAQVATPKENTAAEYSPYRGLKEKVEDNFTTVTENFREYSWTNGAGTISSFIIERPVKVLEREHTFIVDAWGQGYIIGRWGHRVLKINVPVGVFPFTLEMIKQYWY